MTKPRLIKLRKPLAIPTEDDRAHIVVKRVGIAILDEARRVAAMKPVPGARTTATLREGWVDAHYAFAGEKHRRIEDLVHSNLECDDECWRCFILCTLIAELATRAREQAPGHLPDPVSTWPLVGSDAERTER